MSFPVFISTPQISILLAGKEVENLPLGSLPAWLFTRSQEMNFEEMVKGVSEGSRNNSLVQLVGRWISLKLSYADVVD